MNITYTPFSIMNQIPYNESDLNAHQCSSFLVDKDADVERCRTAKAWCLVEKIEHKRAFESKYHIAPGEMFARHNNLCWYFVPSLYKLYADKEVMLQDVKEFLLKGVEDHSAVKYLPMMSTRSAHSVTHYYGDLHMEESLGLIKYEGTQVAKALLYDCRFQPSYEAFRMGVTKEFDCITPYVRWGSSISSNGGVDLLQFEEFNSTLPVVNQLYNRVEGELKFDHQKIVAYKECFKQVLSRKLIIDLINAVDKARKRAFVDPMMVVIEPNSNNYCRAVTAVVNEELLSDPIHYAGSRKLY